MLTVIICIFRCGTGCATLVKFGQLSDVRNNIPENR